MNMVVVLHKKQIGMVLLCAALIAVVPFLAVMLTRTRMQSASAANTNWGLSFQQEGQAPVGNASAEFLKKYNAYYVGDTSQKKLYITFDAGFENGNINAVMDGDIDGFINAYLKWIALKK